MSKTYWDDRWKNNELGWDIGTVSIPLKTYFDQISDKTMRILIPGAGNAYEAEYLHDKGFENVYVIDISQKALDSFYERCPNFPFKHIICGDFFKLTGVFDLIVEQTFFCAIDPSLRNHYLSHANKLLPVSGKMVGLLFDFPLESGPPYGGNKEEYALRFSKFFDLKTLSRAHNSIAPRAGRELFFIAEKPKNLT